MSIVLSIKIDSGKFRLYFEGSTPLLSMYLESRNYTEVNAFIKNQLAHNDLEKKEISCYQVDLHNLAWRQGFQKVMVEFIYNISALSDHQLIGLLDHLIKPLDIKGETGMFPNMNVDELRQRVYVTVFPPTEIDEIKGLELIQRFEQMALSLVRRVTPDTSRLSSNVRLQTETSLSVAVHLKDIGIFGASCSYDSLPAPAASSSSTYPSV